MKDRAELVCVKRLNPYITKRYMSLRIVILTMNQCTGNFNMKGNNNNLIYTTLRVVSTGLTGSYLRE